MLFSAVVAVEVNGPLGRGRRVVPTDDITEAQQNGHRPRLAFLFHQASDSETQ